MNDRDFDQILDAFLELGPQTAPDRVAAAARHEARETRQTVLPTWWPSWRFPIMSSKSVRYGFAAAAVVLLAILGFGLLQPGGNVGGGPSPTPSASATVDQTPASSPTPPPVPPAGAVSIGRHSFTLDNVTFTLEIPGEGWVSNGDFGIDKGPEIGAPGSAGFIFWVRSAPDNVFSDPCTQTPLDPPPGGPGTAGLAEAVAAIPGTDVAVEPEAITLDGYRGHHVAITIRNDIECSPDSFFLWYDAVDDSQRRFATREASTIHSWIIDANGTRVWIDGEVYEGSGAGAEEELLEIVSSIQFE